ncbi:metal-binding protein ZinT [Pseudooceanicola sp. HF7]|uniref:ZinT family metal-binding protein n=1 Tax=Pseudooceanicola sp. HF7 TaxID=2721560 RepID=UPI00142F8579|nr:metal-binding protein ZinT [Pseudooceanicola sp. HF7]NIZ11587.1 metal-binding protein ZinT [Pseudooceanicola sp. HF7]
MVPQPLSRSTLARSSLALAAVMALALPVSAESHDHDHDHDHDHAEAHSHDHDEDAQRIYKGLFTDEEIQPRTLADWEGDWQSVYPLLQDGSLDEVMAHKAEHGDKSAQEYADYYAIGYETDVDRIVIDGSSFTFWSGETSVEGTYESDGYEVLTYAKGNRGVRYIFEKTEGDDAAPEFVQFSDHAVSPTDAGHYHLYWGDDRAAVLEELTNWPTYYPSEMSAEEIAHEMIAH